MAETIGSLVDKITIVELKRYHMAEQLRRTDTTEAHLAQCHEKLVVLTRQRDDLSAELDELAAYSRDGVVVVEHDDHGFNHSRSTCHEHGQTALPDGGGYELHLRPEEIQRAQEWLDRLGGDRSPSRFIVLNPSASNPFTRGTDRPKAVDNLLGLDDYELLLESLLELFPDSHFIIGSAVKPGDAANMQVMAELSDRLSASSRVVDLTRGTTPRAGISFREFGAILADPRVEAMIGNSTGTNAHLAATVGLPALSIERAADALIIDNWRDRRRGQMGSFRWSNPHPGAATFCLRWSERDPGELSLVARCFRYHYDVMTSSWTVLLGDSLELAREVAVETLASFGPGAPPDGVALPTWWRRILELRESLPDEPAVRHLFDFEDPAAYFALIEAPVAARFFSTLSGPRTRSLAARLREAPMRLEPPDRSRISVMLRDTNLYKMFSRLAEHEHEHEHEHGRAGATSPPALWRR